MGMSFQDVEKLKKMNLAKGGSLDNAIVVDSDRIINKEGLRNKNEFVNHKILDCIGDLYLVGYKIIANIKCSEGGHKLTNEILRKVFDSKLNYSIISSTVLSVVGFLLFICMSSIIIVYILLI